MQSKSYREQKSGLYERDVEQCYLVYCVICVLLIQCHLSHRHLFSFF